MNFNLFSVIQMKKIEVTCLLSRIGIDAGRTANALRQ